MQYLCLIYGEEAKDPVPGTPQFDQMMEDFAEYSADVEKAGVLVGGHGLQPVANATTVRVRDSKVKTTDGPFAETKEVLGGYYLLDVKDLDEALAWAAKIPVAKWGSIEVRPVMIFD